jgi:hypothetical protein
VLEVAGGLVGGVNTNGGTVAGGEVASVVSSTAVSSSLVSSPSVVVTCVDQLRMTREYCEKSVKLTVCPVAGAGAGAGAGPCCVAF